MRFLVPKDVEGSKIEIKSEINYYIFFCPKIGDEIKILYTKNDPTKANQYVSPETFAAALQSFW
jgi:predicted RNA-binding Zn-ribbon protein involved in translation (DUF1610 family)